MRVCVNVCVCVRLLVNVCDCIMRAVEVKIAFIIAQKEII